MRNLKCAVLVTKANDKSSPLTLHFAQRLSYRKLSFERERERQRQRDRERQRQRETERQRERQREREREREEEVGSERPWGLARALNFRIDLIRQGQVLRISTQSSDQALGWSKSLFSFFHKIKRYVFLSFLFKRFCLFNSRARGRKRGRETSMYKS